ncbi:MAG: PAS domain S-box protein [Syntrophaceae bacterium]|nr:PAS domain S-box protein [Syntrophaceae bacterium]
MTEAHLSELDQAERNTRWIVFSRLAVVSYFLGVIVYIQFRAVGKLPEEYLWISYSLISVIYAFSALCLAMPRTARRRRLHLAGQSFFDVVFVTGIVLLTGGIDSVYSVLYSLVIIYSTLFLGRKGGLSIAALCSLSYVLVVNLDCSGTFEFLYDEGIVSRGELTRGYILTRVTTHVASFFIMALLASFVVEQERRTKRLLAEKVTAFDRLDLLHRSIIESIDTGILTVNLVGQIRSFNRAAEEISGFTLGEVFNRSVEEIFPGVSAVIAQAGPDEGVRQRRRFEIVIRRKSGESVILGISGSPLYERGVKIGSILIFQDLTAFKAMEREGERNKQLAFIGQMAAGLAHELRTPLQSISGSIQILRRDLKLEPTDERLMQVILRGKDQMESLVRNFLLMARANRGSRSVTDIGRLVEDVTESLTVGADWNPRVELRKELGQGLKVMGDPAEIRQVLWNLMINAIQAMPEGGTLTVTAAPEGENGSSRAVRVEIGDSGSGIAPDQLEKIWEPFYTTKERGSGLGLAIVRRIVESHGGSVEVQSEVSRGTRFAVRFPRIAPEESDGTGEEGHPARHAAAAGAAQSIIRGDHGADSRCR